MAEVLTAIQTAEAIGGLIKIVKSIQEYCVKVARAPEAVEEVQSKLKGFSEILEPIKALLEIRQQQAIPQLSQYDSLEFEKGLKLAADECTETLGQIQQKLSKFIAEEEYAAMGLRDRMRVVHVTPGLRKDLEKLDGHKQTINMGLAAMTLHTLTRQSAISQKPGNITIVIDFSEILKGMQQFDEEGDVSPTQALPSRCVTIDSSFDEQAARLLGIEQSREPVQRVMDKLLRSQRLPSVETLRQPVSLPPSDVNQTELVRPSSGSGKSILTGCGSGPSLQPVQDTRPERVDSILEPTPTHNIEALSQLIIDYSQYGRQQLANTEFAEAKKSLQKAINYSELRQQRHNVSFEDRIEMQEDLARAHIGLQEWSSAIDILNEHHAASNSEDRTSRGGKVAFARRSQLMASIYLDRYMSDTSRDTEVEDWSKANDLAINALTVWEKQEDTLPIEETKYLQDCLRLLVKLFKSKQLPLEAKIYEGKLTNRSLSLEDFKDKMQCIREAIDNDAMPELRRLFAPPPAGSGIDIDARDEEGTALHYAAERGNDVITKFLLQNGADINIIAKNKTALSKAVKRGRSTVVATLLNWRNGQVDTAIKQDRECTLLHTAVKHTDTRCAELILKANPALLDMKDRPGQTPLHYVAKENLITQAAFLLNHGANPNSLDKTRRTPLKVALEAGSVDEDMLHLLRTFGAELGEVPLPGRQRERWNSFVTRREGGRRATVDAGVPGREGKEDEGKRDWDRRKSEPNKWR